DLARGVGHQLESRAVGLIGNEVAENQTMADVFAGILHAQRASQRLDKGSVQMGNQSVQVVAVTGGKGGVGKTNVSVNLALALAEVGRSVEVLEPGRGLAIVCVELGLRR